jgi:hypothetical protein
MYLEDAGFHATVAPAIAWAKERTARIVVTLDAGGPPHWAGDGPPPAGLPVFAAE